MLQAELRVLSGKQTGSAIPLPSGKFLIGREEDCHLRPNSDLVSRHHCVFTLDEYGLRLRDLGSTNGSFVNGEKIRGAVVLNAGDSVSIGKLEFQVIIGDPITDETRTNLANDLPTEIISASSPEGEDDPSETTDVVSADETVSEPSTSDTMMEIPTIPPAGTPPTQEFPQTGDTQYFPPAGGMPPQMPVGYPPQMGYPQGMMPYGYPGYPPQQPMGYPQQQMGYPPGMQPPMPGQEAIAPEAEAPQKIEEPAVRLPDPTETGAKAPEPKPATPPPSEGGEQTAEQKAKEEAPSAAADAIQQYLQRRPKGTS